MRPELPILKKQTNWQSLYFYQKTVVLYQMTVVFCRRFLPKFGDRTVDDYLRAHQLALWRPKFHPRYDGMLKFCRSHNAPEGYEPYFAKWSDEEFANCANTLCHMVDKMMSTHMAKMAADFKENGGIRERMTAARLWRRQTQNEEIAALKAEVSALRAEIARLRGESPERREVLEKLELLESQEVASSARAGAAGGVV